MATTIGDILTTVRGLIQDSDAQFRNPDALLISYLNKTLRTMVLLRPDLFIRAGSVASTENTTRQNLARILAPRAAANLRPMRFVSVLQASLAPHTTPRAVTEVNKRTLDQTQPDWVSVTAGIAVNYMPNMADPLSFFIYPKSPPNQNLLVEYVHFPKIYATVADTFGDDASVDSVGIGGSDSIFDDAKEGYISPLIDGIVYLASSVDSESVNSGRAKLFYETFINSLGVSESNKELTSPAYYQHDNMQRPSRGRNESSQ